MHSDALQSMQTLLFCPSDCLNALYCAFWQVSYDTAHYGFSLTLCGADSWHGLPMRPRRIAGANFSLEPQEVRENHIMRRETRNLRETRRFRQLGVELSDRPTYCRLIAKS